MKVWRGVVSNLLFAVLLSSVIGTVVYYSCRTLRSVEIVRTVPVVTAIKYRVGDVLEYSGSDHARFGRVTFIDHCIEIGADNQVLKSVITYYFPDYQGTPMNCSGMPEGRILRKLE